MSALWLCFLLAAACPAQAEPERSVSPPVRFAPRLDKAYQLGLAVYGAQAAVIALDETIEQSKPTVGHMAALAAETRATEFVKYRRAETILRSMSAPVEVDTPFVQAISTLASPVAIDREATSRFPHDAAARQVWATLDEADRISPDETVQLDPWLKLSRGRAATWAYHLGCLVAVLHAGIPGDPSRWPLVGSAASLGSSSPKATPLALTDALKQFGADAATRRISRLDIDRLESAAASLAS